MKEIFAIIRAGEIERGVEMLYDVHYNKMYAIAFSIVNDRQTSEDIVHNVVYKLLTLDKELFPRGGESAWLYYVIKNEAINFINKQSKYIVQPIKDIVIEDKNIEDYVDLDAYYSMIKDLKPAQKEIVTLKVLGSYTYKEISDIVGKSIGTVKWMYATAIKQLRLLLAGFIPAIVVMMVGALVSAVLHILQMVDVLTTPWIDATLDSKPTPPNIQWVVEMMDNTASHIALFILALIIIVAAVFLAIFNKKYKKIEKILKNTNHLA